MTQVKICGLTDPDLVRFAAREGADWIGFNFVPGSPRRVTPEAAASLLLQVGKARPVARYLTGRSLKAGSLWRRGCWRAA